MTVRGRFEINGVKLVGHPMRITEDLRVECSRKNDDEDPQPSKGTVTAIRCKQLYIIVLKR